MLPQIPSAQPTPPPEASAVSSSSSALGSPTAFGEWVACQALDPNCGESVCMLEPMGLSVTKFLRAESNRGAKTEWDGGVALTLTSSSSCIGCGKTKVSVVVAAAPPKFYSVCMDLHTGQKLWRLRRRAKKSLMLPFDGFLLHYFRYSFGTSFFRLTRSSCHTLLCAWIRLLILGVPGGLACTNVDSVPSFWGSGSAADTTKSRFSFFVFSWSRSGETEFSS